jgi:hypothetical protein
MERKDARNPRRKTPHTGCKRGRSPEKKIPTAQTEREKKGKKKPSNTEEIKNTSARITRRDQTTKNTKYHFYEEIESLRSIPRKKGNPQIRSVMDGWNVEKRIFPESCQGTLRKARNLPERTRSKVEEEDVKLLDDPDAPGRCDEYVEPTPGEGEYINPYYANTEEPLRTFLDPEAVKSHSLAIISGRKLRIRSRSRRKKYIKKKRWNILNKNYQDNTKCRICGKDTIRDNKT